MKWLYADRFGMFIHFGSYSYLGHGERAFFNEKWTKKNYQTQVYAKFDPVKFNAGTIAGLAIKAGKVNVFAKANDSSYIRGKLQIIISGRHK